MHDQRDCDLPDAGEVVSGPEDLLDKSGNALTAVHDLQRV